MCRMFPIIPNRIAGTSSGYNARQSPVILSRSSERDNSSDLWNLPAASLSKDVLKSFKSTKGQASLKMEHKGSGCFAYQFIPKDAKAVLLGSIDSSVDGEDGRISVCLSENGFLQAKDKMPVHRWIKHLKLSKDIHSYNVMLDVGSQHGLHLWTTRDIGVGDEIVLWFSEEVLAIMSIPFLSPANIRGKNCYKCTQCDEVYEYPNPLKIHIATKCSQEPISTLWNRLYTSIYPTTRLLPPALYPTSTLSTQSWTHQSPYRISAFHPVNWSANKLTTNPDMMISSALVNAYNNDTETATAAAHLETMVSNMGTSKQGHLCIYCGKLYSRKYGLKIHIRTHTGFKPLKCKYCLRPFGDPSNLNKHVRLHVQGNTVYKCNECDKIMIRRRDLQRHIRSRHGNDGNNERNTLTNSSSSSASSDEESTKTT